MSGTPLSFPVWLSKLGSPDAYVNDTASYNYAVSQGYSLPSAGAAAPSDQSSTPSVSVAPAEEVAEVPISTNQPLDVVVAPNEPAVVQQTTC